jgi:hypothetical protein
VAATASELPGKFSRSFGPASINVNKRSGLLSFRCGSEHVCQPFNTPHAVSRCSNRVIASEAKQIQRARSAQQKTRNSQRPPQLLLARFSRALDCFVAIGERSDAVLSNGYASQ